MAISLSPIRCWARDPSTLIYLQGFFSNIDLNWENRALTPARRLLVDDAEALPEGVPVEHSVDHSELVLRNDRGQRCGRDTSGMECLDQRQDRTLLGQRLGDSGWSFDDVFGEVSIGLLAHPRSRLALLQSHGQLSRLR
jgi:hypothetical protein